jgi:putative nucleotidyltransferase with HDIG domain
MRHVLFVDDDVAVLSGLRRMLHPMRSQWQMTFVANADAALAAVATCPADVVVTDLQLARADGVALLAQVRARWPQTVRLILSGSGDEGAALRSIPVAHRFLNKPCDAALLTATVRGACDLRDRLPPPELRTLIGGLGALPSAPRSFAAITAALGRPEVCLDTVAATIERDAGCTAKLLQLANSAFFGLARSVTRVRDAVTALGIARVRDVVLAGGMVPCPTPRLAAITQEINDHSALVADAARKVAGPGHAPEAFAAGTLHDIGRLALAAVLGDRYTPLTRRHRGGEDLSTVEVEVLGAGHAEVGAYLLQLWGLPDPLVDAVARHHDEHAGGDANPLLAAVATAHQRVHPRQQDAGAMADTGGLPRGLLADEEELLVHASSRQVRGRGGNRTALRSGRPVHSGDPIVDPTDE